MTKERKQLHISDLSKASTQLTDLSKAVKRIGLFELSHELRFIEGIVSFAASSLAYDLEKTKNK